MGDIKFKLSELVSLRDSINSREEELKNSLNQLNQVKKTIKKILGDEKNSSKDVIIYLPKDSFENIKINSISLKSNFNWKKVVIEILKNSKDALTTLMIYEKAKIKYPLELSDKIKSIHGFSAALAYLRKDKKVEQIKNGKKFFYELQKK